MKKLQILALLLPVFAAVFFFFSGEKSREKLNLSHQPNFFMRGFTLHKTDKHGVITTIIQSPETEYYDAEKYNTLKQPVVNLRDDNSHWVINAHMGESYNNKKILLQGNVTAVNKSGKQQLKTESLWVYPDKNLAETDDYIVLLRESGKTTGIGAKINTSTSEITILEQGKTVFIKEEKKQN